jgi:hypothetical protein
MSQNKTNRYSKKRQRRNKPWLPIIVAVTGVVLVGLAFWGLRGKSAGKADIEVTGAPSLKADKEQVDLGDVKLGQTVEVSFQLTNVGDQTLRFSEAPYIEVVEGC